MRRVRFLWKLQALYVALVLATAAAFGFLVGHRAEADALRDLDETLRVEAALLRELAAPALSGAETEGLTAQVRRLGEETGSRLTVIRADGVVLADSHVDPSTMDDHSTRPEVVEARERGIGRVTRFSHSLRDDVTCVALRVDREGDAIGFVRAEYPLGRVRARLAGLRAVVAAGAVGAALVGIVVGLLAFRRLASPLTSLLRASTSALPETREGGGRGDDVAQLADAFNRMSADLRERMATITGERNRLVAILSAMVEGVVAVDREQRVLHVNEAAAAILGTPASEAMGRPAWEMTRVGEVLDALGVAARELRDLTREARIARPGGERTVQLHASPLRDGQGRPAGAVVVLHDVTELRRLETVRRDFVANVSHELKTPLTAIHGMVETVLDDEGMEAETRRRFLARVHEHSSRLGNLVHDLLALARIEAAEGALERALLDLREPVRDSAARLTPAADAKGLTLEVHLPAEPVEIEGDEEALREVVDNLLDNAVKYTPSGGAVTLTLACGATEATIDVRDTGIGIEKEHLARIFERFYRVDKARSRELGGTGLGLAIVKHLVAAHGGRVSVESEPGAGSAFRVALPRPAPADR